MQANGGNMSMGDKVILSAAIGGTAEVIGGGKPARKSSSAGGFSNGSVTGAFVYLLNHASHQGDGDKKTTREETIQKQKQELKLIGSTAYAKDNVWKVWPLNYQIEAGQHVRIDVKNMNFFGAHIEVSDYSTGSSYSKWFGLFNYTGETFQKVVPPLSTRTFDFYYCGSERRTWIFHFYSESDFINVGIKFYSNE